MLFDTIFRYTSASNAWRMWRGQSGPWMIWNIIRKGIPKETTSGPGAIPTRSREYIKVDNDHKKPGMFSRDYGTITTWSLYYSTINIPYIIWWSKLHYFLFFSALESPTIRSSPSLYEGAFRLETMGSPGNLLSSVHPSMMFNTPDCKPDITDQDESPMSSPIDNPA